MKLCFSTLGCPGWNFSEVFVTAGDFGYQGIEIRGIGEELYAPRIDVFSPQNIEKTKEKLKKSGLCIPILTSNSAFAVPSRAKEDYEHALEYVDLAEKLGTPYIRVMSTAHPQPEDCDLDECAELFAKLCEYAKTKSVMPLLETNGLLADSARMSKFMDKMPDNAGVLWDIHHPYRFYKETPAETVANLGNRIKHVHVKDSLCEDGNIVYKMMGKGDVPVLEAMRALKSMSYNGFVSFEWAKRWNPELHEPGIVFSHFIEYMHLLETKI